MNSSFEKECISLLMQTRPGKIPVETAYDIPNMGDSISNSKRHFLDFFRLGTTSLPEEKGIAFLGKGDQSVYVFGYFEDSDVFNTATGKNTQIWKTGDVMEFLFQPPECKRYYELHLTPRNVTFEVRIPGTAKSGNSAFKSPLYDFGLFSHAEEFDLPEGKGWLGLMKIPFDRLGITEDEYENSRFAVCRYNYNRKWSRPEISSTVIFPEGGFHQPELWHEIKAVEGE